MVSTHTLARGKMVAKTKIICTIGPSVNSYEKIVSLIEAGMNVARLNFSHGTHAEHQQVIELIKKARTDLGVPLAIMLDTKGPEIRLKKLKDGSLLLVPGHEWILQKTDVEGDSTRVAVSPGYILDNLKEGTEILFDDGYISSHVIKKIPEGVVVRIDNGGLLRSGKGINIPDANLEMPAITDQDIADIRFGCSQDVDIIAASFVRSAADALLIRDLLKKENKAETLLIAKIENKEGVENFDSILQVADGIMIARGDLGVQLPLSRVPGLQKKMIKKCYLAGKPAVTATQMLESMIGNPRPTRAEVSDVANAIYDSSSAVMLSGETAIGKYPIEAVQMMKNIIKEAESDFNYNLLLAQHSQSVYPDVPSAVTLATVKTAYSSNAKCILAFTNRGSTARLISRLRPQMPIIALTSNQKSYHQLAIEWGVIPFIGKNTTNTADAFKELSRHCLHKKYVSVGDLVVIAAGSPFGVSGSTNQMLVDTIGDVL
jgi:pyruvate kinase